MAEKPYTHASPPPLPVFDVGAHDREVRGEIETALARVLASNWFILGPELERFESAFAAYLGDPDGEVVGVGSGTDALRLSLAAAGIGPGDSVLTVPNTAVPTVSAISAIGARPRFVDVDRATGLIDPGRIEEALTPDTRAIVPVHLYGRCVPMHPIREIANRRGLVVIEDAAQAHGAARDGRRAGTGCEYGAFSFYPSKNLGAYGDGGAVWVRGRERAVRVRRLRNYGQSDRYRHDTVGINSRLDEIQAAILAVKLRHLDRWNRGRRERAAKLHALLAGLPLTLPPAPEGPDDPACVFHLFVVRVADRDRVRAALAERGIATQVHYPVPVHLQPSYRYLGYGAGDFPEAEAWCREVLSLPFSPVLGENDLNRVAEALRSAWT